MDWKRKKIHNVRPASKEENDRREGIMDLDEIRRDYQRSSDRDRLAHMKAVREAQERARYQQQRGR